MFFAGSPNAYSVRIFYEPLRSLAFGSVSGTYAAVGTPFAYAIREIKVTNLTNANLLISFDGVTNHDVVAATSAYIYDYCSNRADLGGALSQSAGQTLFVKSETSNPSSGNLYVTVIYAA